MSQDEEQKWSERIKQHLKENKKAYLIGGTVGISCFIAGYFLRGSNVTGIISNPDAPLAPTVVNNNTVAPVIEISNNLANNVGHCTKVVQDLETGNLWPKISELAEELAEKHGISFSAARIILSKHLNGHTDQVFGKQYRTIALGTTG